MFGNKGEGLLHACISSLLVYLKTQHSRNVRLVTDGPIGRIAPPDKHSPLYVQLYKQLYKWGIVEYTCGHAVQNNYSGSSYEYVDRYEWSRFESIGHVWSFGDKDKLLSMINGILY